MTPLEFHNSIDAHFDFYIMHNQCPKCLMLMKQTYTTAKPNEMKLRCEPCGLSFKKHLRRHIWEAEY